MKINLVKKIELFTNIAIILVALILGAVLVKKFLLTDASSQPPKSIAVGEKVNFEQINWTSNKNTLLLVLSKDKSGILPKSGGQNRRCFSAGRFDGARLFEDE